MQKFINIGLADTRRGKCLFGIAQQDRLHHIYIIGQTGTGKTTLLGQMALQDVKHGNGFCLIDPHGDLAAAMSQLVPSEHIYWELGNPNSPFGYNPLAKVPPSMRPLVASGFIETLKKQWADSWGPRMEHLLRFALLALLERPGSTIQDIMPLFLDKDFRKVVVRELQDEQVRDFWTKEFPAMNYKNAADGVAPIANKVGAFLAHPLVRRALCTPEKPLRMRTIIDEGTDVPLDL